MKINFRDICNLQCLNGSDKNFSKIISQDSSTIYKLFENSAKKY